MGRFISDKSILKQSDKDGVWYTLHNQLYEDDNGELIFVPRYFSTDGYTIPECVSTIAGGKMKWDIRPSTGHDFECKYHKYLKVIISLEQLIKENIVKTIEKEGKQIIICENIPVQYLKLCQTTFNQTNCRFKRMMKSVKCIKKWRINMMRFAVNLNIGWLFSCKIFDWNKIYKELI